MTDVLTKTQRSFNMSRIRSENTNPEIKFRDFLHSYGIKSFKMHPPEITGKPDFYFAKEKMAIFIDGCFWHGCKKCFRAPNTNREFWEAKIKSNLKRDKAVNKKLGEEGVVVLRVKEHHLKKDSDKVLTKVERVLKRTEQPRVLDLFAGAGGFSEGFVSVGCDMIAHIEMDKDACDTIRTRALYHALEKRGRLDEYEKYLLSDLKREELINKYGLQKEITLVIQAKIDRSNYKNLVAQVKERLNGEKLDFIIGGPPCQAYSHIGRSSDRNHMKRDERKYLYEYYVEFLKALQPKMFVFENVPGLLSAGNGIYLRKMRQRMKKVGYNTDYRILNAAEFGVPQERKRVILIGWNKNSRMKAYPDFQKVRRDYRVIDFLSDLPKLNSGKGIKNGKYKSGSSLLHNLKIINPKVQVLLDHVSRPQRKLDLEIYRIAVKKKNKGGNIRYNELPTRLKTHKNQTGFLDRFKVVDARGMASHTIIAHISKDGHYYIHPDLKQNRSLTVREAARIQTFPDDFKFEGSRTSQFRQIGNAVSPMLSKIIAKELTNLI